MRTIPAVYLMSAASSRIQHLKLVIERWRIEQSGDEACAFHLSTFDYFARSSPSRRTYISAVQLASSVYHSHL